MNTEGDGRYNQDRRGNSNSQPRSRESWAQATANALNMFRRHFPPARQWGGRDSNRENYERSGQPRYRQHQDLWDSPHDQGRRGNRYGKRRNQYNDGQRYQGNREKLTDITAPTTEQKTDYKRGEGKRRHRGKTSRIPEHLGGGRNSLLPIARTKAPQPQYDKAPARRSTPLPAIEPGETSAPQYAKERRGSVENLRKSQPPTQPPRSNRPLPSTDMEPKSVRKIDFAAPRSSKMVSTVRTPESGRTPSPEPTRQYRSESPKPKAPQAFGDPFGHEDLGFTFQGILQPGEPTVKKDKTQSPPPRKAAHQAPQVPQPRKSETQSPESGAVSKKTIRKSEPRTEAGPAQSGVYYDPPRDRAETPFKNLKDAKDSAAAHIKTSDMGNFFSASWDCLFPDIAKGPEKVFIVDPAGSAFMGGVVAFAAGGISELIYDHLQMAHLREPKRARPTNTDGSIVLSIEPGEAVYNNSAHLKSENVRIIHAVGPQSPKTNTLANVLTNILTVWKEQAQKQGLFVNGSPPPIILPTISGGIFMGKTPREDYNNMFAEGLKSAIKNAGCQQYVSQINVSNMYPRQMDDIAKYGTVVEARYNSNKDNPPKAKLGSIPEVSTHARLGEGSSPEASGSPRLASRQERIEALSRNTQKSQDQKRQSSLGPQSQSLANRVSQSGEFGR